MRMIMLMHMLNKRAVTLFDEELWKQLTYLAHEEGSSVGELVRRAARKVYSEDFIKKQRAQAIKDIIRIRPKFKGKIDFETWVNSGRER